MIPRRQEKLKELVGLLFDWCERLEKFGQQ
jgi:hypothetical protein